MTTILSAPKKQQSDGRYFLAVSDSDATITAMTSPRIRVDISGVWTPTPEWTAWATETRSVLLGELVSHGKWFSRPPRRDVLETLFSQWVGTTMNGSVQIFCKSPASLVIGVPGSALWKLKGVFMSATAIVPDWELTDFVDGDSDGDDGDRISLFGETETIVSESEKEIQLAEPELSDKGLPPIQLKGKHGMGGGGVGGSGGTKSRDWETRKFMAKQQVREARLKAQIADHMAAKEEARFHRMFGDLEDNESHFSDYDLDEEEDSDEDSDEDENGGETTDASDNE